MEEKLIVSKNFKLVTYILIAIGVASFALGFIFDAKRTWANYLLNNYYFISIAIGAAFFGAIQYITQSGWSAMFKRIPEAMAAYIPFAAVFFLIMFFGMHSIFEWTHEEVVQHDHLLQYKSPYLNIPFFFIRVIIFFGAWILMSKILRKISLKEDEMGGIKYFEKSELYSKIFIFVIAFTFSLFAVDMLMSLEPHWFSTLFAAKSFIAAFMHGASIITLIVILLSRIGKFEMLNSSHLHDFTRYIFMASIVWGYFNFAEFMLIWYGNIPEETVWFVNRWQGTYKILFFANIVLNWLIPFLVLMPRKTSRSKVVILPVIIILIIGQYAELYYIIWPATVHEAKFGLLEIGTFLGYLGLFSLVVSTSLAKANLVPKNHPYLQESIHHHF
ncbi:quinol:cytochrome C oxidoreductase [Draconibacterium sp.]|nr:quinol:cytochrome C oxidoreductase [Draconibacterium sp.]